MNFIKKKIKKSHKKGSDKDYDFDDLDYPGASSNAQESNDTASKATKDSEEWQFFEQLTQRVQDTVQKTQNTLNKLKDNSAIEVIHKLEEYVEPEEAPLTSPPPTPSLSWVNFDEEGGVKLPPRPPPPKRPPPPPEQQAAAKSPESIKGPPPEVPLAQEVPPAPESGINLLEEFGFQQETSIPSVPPTKGLLIVEDSVLEDEGPDPFDTSFVDLSNPVAPLAPEPLKTQEVPPQQSLLDHEAFTLPVKEEPDREQGPDPFDTSYVETQLNISTSASQGFACDTLNRAEVQPFSFSDSSFSEFKVSEDKLLSEIHFGEPPKESVPKLCSEINFDSLGDVSEKSSSLQPSDLNFDPFDTSFTDTSATLNQKLSNLEKGTTGFLQKNYLLDDHEVQYETLNTLSIDDSTISADPFGEEKINFDNRPYFGKPQEVDLQADFQNLSFKPLSPTQEFDDLDNTFNEISELTDTIPEAFEPAAKEKAPSSSLAVTTSDDVNEECTSEDSDHTLGACDLKGLTTSEKADSNKYLDFSLADTTVTDNVGDDTTAPSETHTFEGFRVLDDALDSSAGTQEDFEEQGEGKSSSLEPSKPAEKNFGDEDLAFQPPKEEATRVDTDSSEFDPFGSNFEDNFSVPQDRLL